MQINICLCKCLFAFCRKICRKCCGVEWPEGSDPNLRVSLQDLELLSQELVRLSKEGGPGVSGTAGSGWDYNVDPSCLLPSSSLAAFTTCWGLSTFWSRCGLWSGSCPSGPEGLGDGGRGALKTLGLISFVECTVIRLHRSPLWALAMTWRTLCLSYSMLR